MRSDPSLFPARTARQGPVAAAPGVGGVARLVAGGVLLGTLGVFVHEAGADPVTTTWFRCAFGLLGLSLWLVLPRVPGRLALSPGQRPWVLLAALAQLLGWGLFFGALGQVPIGPATVLVHVQPLWVLLLGAWWLREPVAGRRLVSVLASMAGLVLATGLLEPLAGPGGAGRGAAFWAGVAACIVAGLCNALVTVAARRLHGLPAGVLAWWQCALGTLVLAAWPLLHGWPLWGAAWGWLAGLGLIHTAAAYALIHRGTAQLTSDRVAVLQYVYPAVALVVDRLVYGQQLSAWQLAGLAVMALAIGWGERAPAAAARRRAAVD